MKTTAHIALVLCACAVPFALAGCPVATRTATLVDAAVSSTDLPPQTTFDLSQPDLAPPNDNRDLAVATLDAAVPDLHASPDLYVPPDLYTPPDLTKVVDFSIAPDLYGLDLVMLPDLTPPPDLSSTDMAHPALSYLGSTAAYTSSGGVLVTNTANNVGAASASDSVSVITQTYAQGSVSDVHLIWATDVNYQTQKDVVMSFDKQVGNNDQWYAIIPQQNVGTQVWFYIRADGYNNTQLYDPSTFGSNYTFKFQ